MISSKHNKAKALLISRNDAFNIKNVVEFISKNFDATILIKDRSKNFPQENFNWSGDYIFSYLCPWKLPTYLLQSAKIAAINFHPGPPTYPGTGCYNFAIYHQVKEYGVTCHHLEKKIDTGKIVSVIKFPLLDNDRVGDLINRTYVYLNYLFFEITLGILKDSTLPVSNLEWKRKPYQKKDLDKLCELSNEMNDDEINKRIKATTFPGKPGPHFID